jgi:Ca2+-transporting ATPase
MTNTNEVVTRQGLTTEAARKLQEQYGRNELTPPKKENLLGKICNILGEPMFLLLLAAAIIYFLLGEPRDGCIMLVFVLGMISIDVVQEWKTDKTLSALKDLSAPQVQVIRDGREQLLPSAELVPGDLMLLCEGVKIPADGEIISCADLCVDESSLTGEAEGVWKKPCAESEPVKDYWRPDYCYAGTLVTQGTALVQVQKIGGATEYGKIGLGVAAAPVSQTPLQQQTGRLVRICALMAGLLCLLQSVFTWLNIPDHVFKDRLIESVLGGVTLAMAMIPEEFPVILTVFLSMGAWRLAKKQSLVRKLPSVETLGAVSVLCVDKTGTITLNQMKVQQVWRLQGTEAAFLETLGLACETEAYDPMEKAMLRYCAEQGLNTEELFQRELVLEYPFTHELKMMGHVWRKQGQLVLAAKGSPEKILTLCALSLEQARQAEAQIRQMSDQGLRVIALAQAQPETVSALPAALPECRLTFLGLIGLADPPRPGVEKDIAVCSRAGIRVVMITGDNGLTAAAIAKKIGIPVTGSVLTGTQLDAMDEEELQEAVRDVNIFSRVVPEHKLRIVKAFQANGEIVAMTGDGVNDAPALKHADIGIAMGKRGSEVAREAADLILLDDNFNTIVETVRDGRRIYDNIRKAVGYVLAIHVPIALASLLTPLLGIEPEAYLLLPLQVVLLEIIVDPTCSIVLERQPAEADIMDRAPRDPREHLLTGALLGKSLLQGLCIFAVSFGAYYLTLAAKPAQAAVARSLGLTVIILANQFLVLVNSSTRALAYRSCGLLARDPVMWLVNTLILVMLAVILYSPLAGLLKLGPLSLDQLLTAVALAAGAVFWYELVKVLKPR